MRGSRLAGFVVLLVIMMLISVVVTAIIAARRHRGLGSKELININTRIRIYLCRGTPLCKTIVKQVTHVLYDILSHRLLFCY